MLSNEQTLRQRALELASSEVGQNKPDTDVVSRAHLYAQFMIHGTTYRVLKPKKRPVKKAKK